MLRASHPKSAASLEQGGRGSGTGLEPGLRSGIEALSGVDFANVRVIRNSVEPARLGAHAFTQGREIHLAPGQEHHLPHEAWHVVQQAQGRVGPTADLDERTSVNDDEALEREADTMGARAIEHGASSRSGPDPRGAPRGETASDPSARAPGRQSPSPGSVLQLQGDESKHSRLAKIVMKHEANKAGMAQKFATGLEITPEAFGRFKNRNKKFRKGVRGYKY